MQTIPEVLNLRLQLEWQTNFMIKKTLKILLLFPLLLLILSTACTKNPLSDTENQELQKLASQKFPDSPKMQDEWIKTQLQFFERLKEFVPTSPEEENAILRAKQKYPLDFGARFDFLKEEFDAIKYTKSLRSDFDISQKEFDAINKFVKDRYSNDAPKAFKELQNLANLITEAKTYKEKLPDSLYKTLYSEFEKELSVEPYIAFNKFKTTSETEIEIANIEFTLELIGAKEFFAKKIQNRENYLNFLKSLKHNGATVIDKTLLDSTTPSPLWKDLPTKFPESKHLQHLSSVFIFENNGTIYPAYYINFKNSPYFLISLEALNNSTKDITLKKDGKEFLCKTVGIFLKKPFALLQTDSTVNAKPLSITSRYPANSYNVVIGDNIFGHFTERELRPNSITENEIFYYTTDNMQVMSKYSMVLHRESSALLAIKTNKSKKLSLLSFELPSTDFSNAVPTLKELTQKALKKEEIEKSLHFYRISNTDIVDKLHGKNLLNLESLQEFANSNIALFKLLCENKFSLCSDAQMPQYIRDIAKKYEAFYSIGELTEKRFYYAFSKYINDLIKEVCAETKKAESMKIGSLIESDYETQMKLRYALERVLFNIRDSGKNYKKFLPKDLASALKDGKYNSKNIDLSL